MMDRYRALRSDDDDCEDGLGDDTQRRRELALDRKKKLDEALDLGLEETFPLPTRFRSPNHRTARMIGQNAKPRVRLW